MSTPNDAQQQEQQRVDAVIEQIKARAEQTDHLVAKAHYETDVIQKNYGDNNSVNTFEVDDRIETNAELQQQKQMVERAVESEAILKRQVGVLKDLRNSPYFGRIDIQDDPDDDAEQLYIGTASFVDDQQNFLVYDWRAPISSVYYNGTLGQVDYDTPAGKQTTELLKKRQFQIEHGEIKNMFDTNETVGDEILQSVLGEQNDAYMQNIVATIQKEQNDIIRDTYSDLLVVQGVAGSGKTSAILQRIAFLLYHSRASLEADQMVLFSPNRLFSHYISEVLPSLGERNMRQVTLAEFLSARFQGLSVQSLFERYEVDQQADATDRAVRDFQEGASFMTQVSDYCHQLPANELRFTNIVFNGETFFSRAEITAIATALPAAMQPADRFLSIKNTLIKRLKRRIDQEAEADWVHEQIDQMSDETYHDLLGDKRRGDFQSMDDEVFYIGKQIVTKRLRQVYDAIYNGYFLDTYEQYNDFLSQTTYPATITAETWQTRLQQFQAGIEYHRIALIDCAPLLLLRDILTGSGENRRMQYIFVDEMQDYSLAQLLYIKHAFPLAKFTLLGDSEQALFKGIEAPKQLLERLRDAFQVRRVNLITLNKSYRSTMQITNFAKALLPDGDQIQAFTREGALPKVMIRYGEDQALQGLLSEVTHQLTTTHTVAVLTRNLAESKQVYQYLKHHTVATLMADSDRTMPQGVIVLPIYLAKGLEFDSVIAYNISAENYPDQDSVGLLYTIASRAMHHLTLLSIGDVSPLIAHLDPTLFTIEHQVRV
ncbi:DNA helicase (putative) [Lactobacillus plantarum JDM1] [Lactiplantibacillus mudanjiangensis]|uniref:RNA polymerase recycling motor HelD n=1 Tax=Lactiplantibacillus mudanjiangensis TaxID=1296538 RepID=UPI001015610B|nr:RNA polymerase recycling motor HelD [Lactiplantibacillus mudanjiangensis]VDG31604.1 DNA helicase (putative) [Lactobacillus plantarum JDM1] [Lactiplantibacillus mudanjiangensis]